MRSIGMDVHRSFAQVAILDAGVVAASFRIVLEHDAVIEFGKSLWRTDEVVLETTGNTSAIVRLLSPALPFLGAILLLRRQPGALVVTALRQLSPDTQAVR